MPQLPQARPPQEETPPRSLSSPCARSAPGAHQEAQHRQGILGANKLHSPRAWGGQSAREGDTARRGVWPCIPSTLLWPRGTREQQWIRLGSQALCWECLCEALVAESCLGVCATAALQPPPGLASSSAALGGGCLLCCCGRTRCLRWWLPHVCAQGMEPCGRLGAQLGRERLRGLPGGGGCRVFSPGLRWHLSVSAAVQASQEALLGAAKFLKWEQLGHLTETAQTCRLGECLVRPCPKPPDAARTRAVPLPAQCVRQAAVPLATAAAQGCQPGAALLLPFSKHAAAAGSSAGSSPLPGPWDAKAAAGPARPWQQESTAASLGSSRPLLPLSLGTA